MKSMSFVLLACLLLSLVTTEVCAQSKGGIGIKGGLNYNSSGKYFRDAEAIWGDPMNNLGFHVGMFGKINAGPVFFRPELYYTNLKSEINMVQLQTQRIDAPLLAGIHLFGQLVSVFGGPSFHYYLEDELREFDFERFNAGYQFGVGMNLGNVGLDLRYEKVLNGQSVDIDQVFSGEDDFKFQQLVLGLSFKF